MEKLGPKPFHIRGPLNSSALDSVLCTILENLEKMPNNLGERYEQLKSDEFFSNATFYGTSDVGVVHTRFKAAYNYLVK